MYNFVLKIILGHCIIIKCILDCICCYCICLLPVHILYKMIISNNNNNNHNNTILITIINSILFFTHIIKYKIKIEAIMQYYTDLVWAHQLLVNVHRRVSPGWECWRQWMWVFSSECPGWPAGSPSCPASAVYSHSAFHSLQETEKHYSHRNHLTLQVCKGHAVMLLTSGFELGGFCSLELKFFFFVVQLFLQTLVLKNKQVFSLALMLMMVKTHSFLINGLLFVSSLHRWIQRQASL